MNAARAPRFYALASNHVGGHWCYWWHEITSREYIKLMAELPMYAFKLARVDAPATLPSPAGHAGTPDTHD